MAGDWKEKLKQLKASSTSKDSSPTREEEGGSVSKELPPNLNSPLSPSTNQGTSTGQRASQVKLRPGMNYESLIQANKALSEENQRLEMSLTFIQGKVDELQSSCNSLARDLQAKDIELKNLRETYSDLPQGNELVELLVTIKDLSKRKAELNRLAEDLNRRASRTNLEEAQLKRVAGLDQDIANLRQEREAIRASAKELGDRWVALQEAESNFSMKVTKLREREHSVQLVESDVKRVKTLERQIKRVLKQRDEALEGAANQASLNEKLEQKRRSLQAELRSSKALVNEQESKIADLSNELLLAPSGEFFIRSLETLYWLTSHFSTPQRHQMPREVLLIGDGPWDLGDLEEFLVGKKFKVDSEWTNPRCEFVVVGRNNWDPDQIEEQIALRDGKPLRVYPQELFVAFLILGVDPFELASVDELLLFAQDHSLMEYLFEQQFPWPDSSYQEDGPINIGESLDAEDGSSPMFKLGYSVAQNRGLSDYERQRALEKALAAEDLPWCISDDYMEEWGSPQSAARLRRMAWHIYLMTKRHRQHKQAVEKWVRDLGWLQSEKYRPIHRFRWPQA